MSDLSDFHDEGLAGFEEVDSGTFTMRGKKFCGVIEEITASEVFAAGGAIPSAPVQIVMRKQTFVPPLDKGEQITINGRNYTVRQLSQDFDITMICELTDKR